MWQQKGFITEEKDLNEMMHRLNSYMESRSEERRVGKECRL